MILQMIVQNKVFKNALKNSDLENIKHELDKKIKEVFKSIMKDNIELFG